MFIMEHVQFIIDPQKFQFSTQSEPPFHSESESKCEHNLNIKKRTRRQILTEGGLLKSNYSAHR